MRTPSEKTDDLEHAVLMLRHALHDPPDEMSAWKEALARLFYVEKHTRAIRSTIRARMRALATKCPWCGRKGAMRDVRWKRESGEGIVYEKALVCRFCEKGENLPPADIGGAR